MNKGGIEFVQQLLYVWISNLGKRSLESIKQNCNYLNEIYHLELSHPFWDIFWPLVLNGVVEHVGNGFYALSEPIVLDYKTHYYYVNSIPKEIENEYASVGITFSEKYVEIGYKVMQPSPVTILKKYPCIKDVVDTFPKTLENEENLKYVNWKLKKGLAEFEKDGLIRYFSLPEQLYLRQIPHRTLNPEAYALSYCLTRVVCNESNGKFNSTTRQLTMPIFAIPFMVYRVLLLECMSSKLLPRKRGSEFIFEYISNETITQLNRIFCNSILYE